MKLNNTLMIAALVAGCLFATEAAVRAQDSPNNAPVGVPSQRSRINIENIAKQLALSEDQKAEVKPVFDDMSQKMAALRQDSSLDPAGRGAKMKEIRENTNAKLKDILTPDQYDKWTKMSQRTRRPPDAGGPQPATDAISAATGRGVPVGANANPEAAMTALFGDPSVVKGAGFEIKRSDLEQVVTGAKANAAASGQRWQPDLEATILNQLITIQVLLQKANADDQAAGRIEADKQYSNLLKKFATPDAFDRQLKAVGMTVEVLRAKATQEAVAKAALKRLLGITVTDEEAKQYYDQHPADFEQPERVHARHILLMTIDPATRLPLAINQIAAKRKEIDSIHQRLLAGQDFATLAKEYSEDPGSKGNGGELPEFSRGQMVPEFETAAFALAVNQISDVVTTKFGYHLIKVLDKTPAKQIEFATAETEIKDFLSRKQITKVAPAFVKQLRTEEKVEVLDPALKAMDEQLQAAVASTGNRVDDHFQTTAASSTDSQSETTRFRNSGNSKVAKSDWDGAIADYTKAIELKPDDAEVYCSRGTAKDNKGDWDGAIVDYIKAIEIKPDDADVRRRAAERLGQLGNTGAVASLLRFSGNDTEAVQTAVEAALIKLGSASVAGFVPILNDTNSNDRIKAVEILGRTGNKQAVEPLVALLPDASLRQTAAVALDKLGEPLGKRWLRLLAGENVAMDEAAASKDGRMQALLIGVLRDEDATTRGNAARALGKLGDAQAVEPLIQVLGDGSNVVRQDAAEALGELGDQRVIKPLIQALGDGSIDVRGNAATALGRLGDVQAIEPLIHLLGDGHDVVRRNTAEALVKLGAPSVNPLVQALESGEAGARTNAAGILIRLGSGSVPALVSVLKSSKPTSRLWAIELLGRIGDKQAVEPLVAMLPDVSVRQAAAEALDKLGEPLGGRWVRMLQGDRAAMGELTAKSDPRVAGLLVQTLGDQDATVRGNVATALGILKVNQGVEPLVGRLADASPLVRQRAAEALGNIGDVGAVPPLIRSLDNIDSGVRQSAAKALWQLPRPAGAAMLAAPLAAGAAWPARLQAGAYVVSEPNALTLDYLKTSQKVLLSGPSLAYSGVLVLVLALPGWIWVRRRRRSMPGIGGWLVMGCLWVVVVLYGLMLRWTWGTAAFLAVALSPAWLSVLMGIGLGVLRWPKEWRRAAGYVCRNDFHRFVPGLQLGWVTRWSGRWLWREQSAPNRLADSCVCRACSGHVSRYEGVNEVVAVLDNQGGTSPQQQDGELRVNWLGKRQPFDFDRVEVVAASDDEVEEFVRQSRYQADMRVQKRLPKMPCVVNAQCRFQREENTMTILRQTFGNVTKD